MNLVNCYVTELIGEPYFKYGYWHQKVKYKSYGSISETTLYRKKKSDLKEIQIDFEFLE